jgi:hypothetical protein
MKKKERKECLLTWKDPHAVGQEKPMAKQWAMCVVKK